jgi:hypothetical protein
MHRRPSVLAMASAIMACARSEQQPPEAPPVSAAAPEPAPAPAPEPAPAPSGTPVDLETIDRVPVTVAHERVQAGRALLVCAYGDARCASPEIALAGAIPLSALQARLQRLARDQEIILYCD